MSLIINICLIIITTIEAVKLILKCVEINELTYTDPPLSEEIARKIYS